MKRLVLIGINVKAEENVTTTLDTPIKVTDELQVDLLQTNPQEDIRQAVSDPLYAWGTTVSSNASREGRWKRVSKLDKLILFNNGTGAVVGIGDIALNPIQSTKTSAYFWNDPKFEHIIMIHNFSRCNVRSSVIWNDLGYASTFHDNGVTVPNDDIIRNLLVRFGSLDYYVTHLLTIHSDTTTKVVIDEDTYIEGKGKLVLHKVKERNPAVIRAAKDHFKSNHNGRLFCEVCGFDFERTYGEIGEDYIEGHHIVPLSALTAETLTSVDSIALVCSNCHRMLHRQNPPLSIEQLQRAMMVSG
ncbi:HNH endonuclease [Alicyclobacillus dauci]|uniref:HNH endonuclease n=1 Tax=Alicyclobacillus dauci TaxID=1475485 RepID=A0ABY6Z2H8_9BACL|nr:HNH endonuclease [Alicyclobacillus dauci]WAH37036.1 HNH endonuclease [Alicyclobacillus dauci]